MDDKLDFHPARTHSRLQPARLPGPSGGWLFSRDIKLRAAGQSCETQLVAPPGRWSAARDCVRGRRRRRGRRLGCLRLSTMRAEQALCLRAIGPPPGNKGAQAGTTKHHAKAMGRRNTSTGWLIIHYVAIYSLFSTVTPFSVNALAFIASAIN